jgi:hypothetical protein
MLDSDVYTLVVSNNAALWENADAACEWTSIGNWFTFRAEAEAEMKVQRGSSGSNAGPWDALRRLMSSL